VRVAPFTVVYVNIQTIHVCIVLNLDFDVD